MSLLLSLGCGSSTTEAPDSIAAVRVTIDIEQRTERQPEGRDPYEFSHVSVVLADGSGTAIERPDIKVLMNGAPLEFRVGQGNYYDRHPRYTLAPDAVAQIQPDTEYAFTIQWIDGTTHDAGRLRTPRPVAPAQFTFPETHTAGRPLTIAWRGVAPQCDLIAYHGFEFPDEAGNMVQQGGSVNADDVRRATVGGATSANGQLEIPASYFAAEGKRRVASFGADVTCAAELPLTAFAEGSRLRASRSLVFRTELPAPAAR